jgi:hypothetical protein
MGTSRETGLVIEQITVILSHLPEEKIKETAEFVSLLAENDQKYGAFVKRILEIEKEPVITCTSIEDVINATRECNT